MVISQLMYSTDDDDAFAKFFDVFRRFCTSCQNSPAPYFPSIPETCFSTFLTFFNVFHRLKMFLRFFNVLGNYVFFAAKRHQICPRKRKRTPEEPRASRSGKPIRTKTNAQQPRRGENGGKGALHPEPATPQGN